MKKLILSITMNVCLCAIIGCSYESGPSLKEVIDSCGLGWQKIYDSSRNDGVRE